MSLDLLYETTISEYLTWLEINLKKEGKNKFKKLNFLLCVPLVYLNMAFFCAFGLSKQIDDSCFRVSPLKYSVWYSCYDNNSGRIELKRTNYKIGRLIILCIFMLTPINNTISTIDPTNSFEQLQPPFSTVRFTGMVVVAYLFSTVVSLAIPEDIVGGLSWQWLHVFTPLAAALGEYQLPTFFRRPHSYFHLCIVNYFRVDEKKQNQKKKKLKKRFVP